MSFYGTCKPLINIIVLTNKRDKLHLINTRMKTKNESSLQKVLRSFLCMAQGIGIDRYG